MRRLQTGIITLLCAAILWCVPGVGMALTAAEVYDKVRSSIHTLYSLDYQTRRLKARGTAVAINKDVVVTNCHVALAGDYLLIKIGDDEKLKEAKLVYKNPQQDLCLLEIPGVSLSPVTLRPSVQVKIGEVVFAVGNPKGTEKTISQGIVSNKHDVDGGEWLQTDAAIYFGLSGGGLFDDKGNLVGITTKMGGSFGFAIPTEWITAVLMSPNAKALLAGKNVASSGDSKTTLMDNANDKVYSGALTGLNFLGNYGKDKIGLYRNNRECFLAIAGKDSNGSMASTILWNPKYDRTLVIFPSASNVKEAMAIVYGAVIDKKTQKQETYRSDSVLVVAGNPYPLYGTKSITKRYPFLVEVFSQSPRTVFLNSRAFKGVFKDKDPQIGNETI